LSALGFRSDADTSLARKLGLAPRLSDLDTMVTTAWKARAQAAGQTP
jgi:hypothetical protein